MSSLNSLGGSVCFALMSFALMSFVLGGLAEVLGPTQALIILTLIGLPVIYLYWILFHNERKLIV